MKRLLIGVVVVVGLLATFQVALRPVELPIEWPIDKDPRDNDPWETPDPPGP